MRRLWSSATLQQRARCDLSPTGPCRATRAIAEEWTAWPFYRRRTASRREVDPAASGPARADDCLSPQTKESALENLGGVIQPATPASTLSVLDRFLSEMSEAEFSRSMAVISAIDSACQSQPLEPLVSGPAEVRLDLSGFGMGDAALGGNGPREWEGKDTCDAPQLDGLGARVGGGTWSDGGAEEGGRCGAAVGSGGVDAATLSGFEEHEDIARAVVGVFLRATTAPGGFLDYKTSDIERALRHSSTGSAPYTRSCGVASVHEDPRWLGRVHLPPCRCPALRSLVSPALIGRDLTKGWKEAKQAATRNKHSSQIYGWVPPPFLNRIRTW